MLVSNDIDIYAGQTKITKVYNGTNVVYGGEEPIPYTQLQYLESTGYQYINTGFSATINTKIEINFQYTENTKSNKTRIFGSRRDWNLNGFYAGTANNAVGDKYWFLVGDIINDRWRASSLNADKNKHNLILSKEGAFMDGTNIWTPMDVVSSFPSYSTIALFGAFEGANQEIQKGTVRIYNCKICTHDRRRSGLRCNLL